MKKFYLLLVSSLWILTLGAQSIRKNFHEMTEYEKIELVNALYELREGPDLITDLANFHMDFFNFDNTSDPTQPDLHFNLPDEPERDIFLGWHRRMIFELEQAIQAINPKISVAYWDSSIDQSTNSPLWGPDLLGSFNVNWGLGRNLGSGGPLPTPTDVSNLMGMSNFLQFSNELERRPVHRGAHVWVGGAMPTPLSPRDPVFYFHHTFVDKVWHDWEEIYHNSAFMVNSMLRYDGTYQFDGVTLPIVNPNDLTDTRSLGVFYGENGLAQLDNYIVSNTYHSQEVFYYQFAIEAGNNFIIPDGTDCLMESVNEITLLPGFNAQSGAIFTAAIDQGSFSSKTLNNVVREYKPFDFVADLQPIVWEEGEVENKPVIITAFPNPFTEKITIELTKKTNCAVEVFNMMGTLIRQETFENTDRIEINKLYGLSSGFYVIRVVDSNGDILMVKRVVKL